MFEGFGERRDCWVYRHGLDCQAGISECTPPSLSSLSPLHEGTQCPENEAQFRSTYFPPASKYQELGPPSPRTLDQNRTPQIPPWYPPLPNSPPPLVLPLHRPRNSPLRHNIHWPSSRCVLNAGNTHLDKTGDITETGSCGEGEGRGGR